MSLGVLGIWATAALADYSGDFQIRTTPKGQTPGKPLSGKVFGGGSAGNRLARLDYLSPNKFTVINRGGKSHTIYPKQKSITVSPMGPRDLELMECVGPDADACLLKSNYKNTGKTERLGTFESIVYIRKDAGGTAELWRTEKLPDVPFLKFVLTQSNGDLTEFVITQPAQKKQPASFFEIPKGYKITEVKYAK